ncbi:MAG: phospho-sugar mutase [Phycisphaerales bacterium]|nr:phospho-sugar mutase [Phycisphaerales bacterium]
MSDTFIDSAIKNWLENPAIAEVDKIEIRQLRDEAAERELMDRFYRELEFGTGGLRGVIGPGINRMNVYTVGAAAQGLANYIAQQGEAAKQAGIAIAYDCRRQSDVFAQRVASVMAGNGIRAYLFDRLRPTPELSFAIRRLGCTAGVVITASHNPPEYNGFKAYWSDGGQIVPPHDHRIIEEVRKVGGFENIEALDEDEARSQGLIKTIGREIDEAFLEEVQRSCLNPAVCREEGKNLRIVFTSLHGTGGALIPEALRRRGFANVIEVAEQAKPDGDFPTVESPNPEEAAALNMAIELAKREQADLVIGTDPDADRVGLAVRREDGDYALITGNRIGALLTYYICEQLKQTDRFPQHGVVLSTIVSSDFMKEIARSYDAEVVETLTGFKWIGRKLHEYDTDGTPDAPSKEFIFGAEESYGYLPAKFARDKDAVTSAAFIAEMSAFAASQGKGLHDILEDLFGRFGYYQEGAKSIVMKGKEGAAQIQQLMETLRNDPPASIGRQAVTAYADLMTGLNKDVKTGEVLERYDLPQSNVIQFMLVDGTKVIARPSGTEPKIKFYILVREPGNDLVRAETAATGKIEEITADLVRRVEAISN